MCFTVPPESSLVATKVTLAKTLSLLFAGYPYKLEASAGNEVIYSFQKPLLVNDKSANETFCKLLYDLFIATADFSPYFTQFVKGDHVEN